MTTRATNALALGAAILMSAAQQGESAPVFPLVIEGEVCLIAGLYCQAATFTLLETGEVESIVYSYVTVGEWSYSGATQRLRMDMDSEEILVGNRLGDCFAGPAGSPALGPIGSWSGCIVP